MKSIKHFLLAVLALATVLTVVSCKDEDDDPSEVVSYTGSDSRLEDFGFAEAKVTFYDNATFRMVANGGKATLEGTYEGDADKDGDITLELTKATMAGQDAPAESLASLSPMIGGDGLSKAGKGTVNGNKLTLGFTYTRS
ncbi:MAG: hypothetical protein HDR57_05120 [Treponema sp.]|nr:hypothetical protein [Treponema sp.]